MLKSITQFTRRLSRLTTLYCLVIFLIGIWPAMPYVVVAILLILIRVILRKKGRLTTLGSACWASESELSKSEMLGGSTGLILGPLWHRNTWRHRRLPMVVRRRQWVRLSQAVHTAAFAPSGTGKTRSLVIPELLTNPKPMVVVDFKGELAAASAIHRAQQFGHWVGCIDPYHIYTSQPATLNPLDGIGKDDPLAIDSCNDLASSIVVRTGHEHDNHWADTAEAVIAAVTATTVAYGEQNTRSLHTVRDIISSPDKLNVATQLMLESDCWNGALRQMGGQLLTLADKERASVLSSALRHLRFLGTPAIAESTATSSFDPAELRNGGKMTLYLILPPDRAQAQSGLLRMWISTLLRACMRGGLQ